MTTPTNYVAAPMLGSPSQITPESAVLTGTIDTGGEPEALLPVPAGGLKWVGGVSISSGVAWSGDGSGNYVPLFGIPTSGSNTDVSVTVTDSAVNSGTPTISSVSNAGADNFSTVTFAYDPVSDYVSSGNQPGGDTLYATGVNVPTTDGLASVQTSIGAFGQSAQDSTGNLPLEPNTQYYYWLVQQAGGTDAATSVNLAEWQQAKANPTNVCLPNVAIAQDPTLASYVSSDPTITYDGTSAPAVSGSCVYYYGDANGANNPQTPVGEFTTAPLGRLIVARSAKVKGRIATVSVQDKSDFRATGTIELDDNAGDTLATGKFALQAGRTGNVRLKLTGAGIKAAEKHQRGQLTLTSNFDQPTATQAIKLLGTMPAKKHHKSKKKK